MPRLPSGLRLLAALAHPDDESLGVGGALAKYSAEGVETHVLCGTKGERGKLDGVRPGPEVMGPLREKEARAAAAELGVTGIEFMGYLDADLDKADPAEAAAKVAAEVRRVRPHVLVTFDPMGAYGHPDHIAISQFALAGAVAAADFSFSHPGVAVPAEPHVVPKLYYMAWSEEKQAQYQSVFGDASLEVDGVRRGNAPWKGWAVATRVDARAHWETVWRAVKCHQSQVGAHPELEEIPTATHEGLWGDQEFYRVWSLVNGGRQPETCLFEGLA